MTHHSRKCPDSQEADTKAEQQRDHADLDQAHRGKWPWPEPWGKTVLKVLKVLLAAATLFVHPINEGAIKVKVTVLFHVPSAAFNWRANQRKKSEPRA